ncbi:hypothetical protein ACQP00_38295 [Dactylosporangium sp. CS-047395]|uniref:hypothetical protein n=1 Tax=Dactylosporangium sp. CS-047395 TaxID=3239936 RepID=UPI003D8F6D13
MKQQRYVVPASPARRWRALGRRLTPVLLVAAAVLSFAASDGGSPALVGAVVVLFGGAAVYVGRRGRPLPELVIETAGVRIGRAAVPWGSIRRLVLGGGTDIGLCLRDGVPLPRGVAGVVYDRARPGDPHVVGHFDPGRIAGPRLLEALSTFAPVAVDVVSESVVRAPAPPMGAAGEAEATALVTAVRMRGPARLRRRYRPFPVVCFDVPGDRRVLTETSAPGEGVPGELVTVSYDPANPLRARVHGPVPQARRLWAR